MTREEFLKSEEYWIGQIQFDLFEVIAKYMEANNVNRTQLASRLNVTKGYITQVLNGDFDHKISKLVELGIACNVVPIVHFVDLDEYIENDADDKKYKLVVIPEKSAQRKTARRSPATANKTKRKITTNNKR